MIVLCVIARDEHCDFVAKSRSALIRFTGASIEDLQSWAVEVLELGEVISLRHSR
jgi:hypothetical protein